MFSSSCTNTVLQVTLRPEYLPSCAVSKATVLHSQERTLANTLRQCLASHIKQNHQISELRSTLATVCPNPLGLQTSREELVFQGGLELDLGPSPSTQKQVDLLHALFLKCNSDAKHLDLGFPDGETGPSSHFR